MFYIIYKTINLINGRFYIGKHKTDNLEDGYLGSGKLLKLAINRYGKQNFRRQILQFCSSNEEMNEVERRLIILCEQSYNICTGGEGNGTFAGHKHSEESRAKLSRSLKGRVSHFKGKQFSEQHKQSMRKPKSEEHCKKLSESTKKVWQEGKIKIPTGVKHHSYGTCWMTNGRENKKAKKEDIDFLISLGYYKGRIMLS